MSAACDQILVSGVVAHASSTERLFQDVWKAQDTSCLNSRASIRVGYVGMQELGMFLAVAKKPLK